MQFPHVQSKDRRTSKPQVGHRGCAATIIVEELALETGPDDAGAAGAAGDGGAGQ